MKQQEISVYLIGKTQVQHNGVEHWLTDKHVTYHYTKEAAPGGTLTTLAGKRCYNAFEVGDANLNLTRVRQDMGEFCDNVLKSGHGCYDKETDVLTKDGWASWDSVNEYTEFATLNKDGLIEYHKPIRLVKYLHSGKMYYIDGKQVNLLVTPEHKMFVCGTTTVIGRKKHFEDYQLIAANVINDTSAAYLKAIPFKPVIKTNNSFYDMGRLYGFSIGDGYGSGNRVRFHLKRDRKISYLREICDLLEFSLIEDESNHKYDVVIPNELNYMLDLYNSNKEKRISRQAMNINIHFLAGVLDGLKNSDGSTDKNGVFNYDTTSYELAGNVQELALLLGYTANISQADCYKDRSKSFGDKPIFRLNINDHCTKPIVNKFNDAASKSSWIDWEGYVYCAEVPNNTLYVRRRGKPVWSGNSVLEHVSYTFAIEGLTRVATAELNRHRAGMAVSEGSGRYIRPSEFSYWLPLSIREQGFDEYCNERGVTYENAVEGQYDQLHEQWSEIEYNKYLTRQLFIKAYGQMQENYAELEAIWEIGKVTDFHTKKQLTSMFRRVLGQGISTGGVWTGNLRALRHVFTMRCDESAEEEICHVATLMLQKMMIAEPEIFGDFKQVDGYWQPQYRKV